MPEKYILALDQGTGSSRAALFDLDMNMHALTQVEININFPNPGWVEQDPEEIFISILQSAQGSIIKAGASIQDIIGTGITNQRESCIVWDKDSGKSVYPAISWQDKRTAQECDVLRGNYGRDFFRDKTGLELDTYFSATKVQWILHHVEGAMEKAKQGKLLFGNIDSWLVYRLSEGNLHITDFSNASRTLLFNINELTWDKELLEIFDIPLAMLPKVVPSSEILGNISSRYFGKEIPLASIIGDQQSALFGNGGFEPGQAKNTYGTGCFLLKNTGSEKIVSESGLLSTIAWGIGHEISYAMEGSVFTAGAVMKWLRDNLGLLSDVKLSEKMARMVPDTGGVYFVPAFSGLGSPYWDMSARGSILGLTQSVNKNHLVRAALESVAFQVYDLVKAMEKDSGSPVTGLQVDGGASGNDFLMQFQADILDVPVARPENIESTIFGAACLAGLSLEISDLDRIKKLRRIEKEFSPKMSEEIRDIALRNWSKAIEKSMHWQLGD